MPAKNKPARPYRHEEEALLRPEAGAQENFPARKRKPPVAYRYDSSLSPELAWDEGEIRGHGERLLSKICDSKNLDEAKTAAAELKKLSQPFLNWSGKAERAEINVPTLPLFVHERLSTAAVLETLQRHRRNRQQTLDLFGESEKSIGEKIRGAYEHLNGWQNRLILGDSLQVMNSLLQYESLGRKVQMVYMDPPYGIKFGGNFQPFVRKRDVKDGDDASLTREPEMVQAYRDTWELNEHSWLTYMRDRLLLARELLNDSGSCFVQISDENVHFVRNVMDEVFGKENFVSQIAFQKSGKGGNLSIPSVFDYLVWYAKDTSRVKFRPLYLEKKDISKLIEDYNLDDGDGKKYRLSPINSQHFSKTRTISLEYLGKKYHPGKNRQWSIDPKHILPLLEKGVLTVRGNSIFQKLYLENQPGVVLSNLWSDTARGSFGETNFYVVQTKTKPVERCMLMTTDPGDLVLDPTCGSGTTAFVAEQWGRRWITTDVSRVPLALARQRLLTASFPYYKLKDDARGPSGGFTYARRQNKKGEETGGIVPHITLKSIANNEPPAEEVLMDKPETAANVTRISGPFCVEAVLPTPLSPESNIKEAAPDENEQEHARRMLSVLQLSPTLHLPNSKLRLQNIRAPAKSMNLDAEGEYADAAAAENIPPRRIAIVFGPANAAISERAVIEAGNEANNKKYAHLLVIGFAIEPNAREAIELGEETFGVAATYAQASADLVMSDLLKNMRSSQIFSVVGLPDVELKKLPEKSDAGDALWQVTLRGLDVFDPVTMESKSRSGDDVPCWMLDTDYDDQCFRAGQVFFPRTGAWEKIRAAVKADFEDDVWYHLAGAVSAPFVAGEQIAVKVFDDRGNELVVVKKAPGGV